MAKRKRTNNDLQNTTQKSKENWGWTLVLQKGEQFLLH